jgi:hypothetical protein
VLHFDLPVVLKINQVVSDFFIVGQFLGGSHQRLNGRVALTQPELAVGIEVPQQPFLAVVSHRPVERFHHVLPVLPTHVNGAQHPLGDPVPGKALLQEGKGGVEVLLDVVNDTDLCHELGFDKELVPAVFQPAFQGVDGAVQFPGLDVNGHLLHERRDGFVHAPSEEIVRDHDGHERARQGEPPVCHEIEAEENGRSQGERDEQVNHGASLCCDDPVSRWGNPI